MAALAVGVVAARVVDGAGVVAADAALPGMADGPYEPAYVDYVDQGVLPPVGGEIPRPASADIPFAAAGGRDWWYQPDLTWTDDVVLTPDPILSLCM